ncbi:MAG: hypothetical protein ACTSQE_11715 [Candidatus Heimdallarchaeaceae archaeon]
MEEATDEFQEQSIDQFSIIRPTKFKWLIIISISFFCNFIWTFLNIKFLALLILVSSIIVIATIFWGFFGKWTTNKLVIESLEKLYQEKQEIGKIEKRSLGLFRRMFLRFIGLKIQTDYHYYIEKEGYQRDLNKLKNLLTSKLVDTISASLGVGFLVITFIKPFITTWEEAMIIAVITLLSTPVISGIVVPTFWLIKDTRVKYVRDNHDILSLEEDIRKGFLNRFLGFSGFITGLNFLLQVLPLHPDFNLGTGIFASLGIFLISVFILLVLTILLAGMNLLIAVIYLIKYHESRVNEFRERISKMLPIGESTVNYR